MLKDKIHFFILCEWKRCFNRLYAL